MPIYKFREKHRWQIKLHMMSGITIMQWLQFLFRYASAFNALYYLHRFTFLTFMACINSLLAIPDRLFYSRRVGLQVLHPEPVFILGQPRTGTTHLHNLLALDTERFAFATTFHAGFPSSFLCLEPLRWLLSPLLERTRPMDNMALTWDLPAEDEIAVNTITGGLSPYAAIVVPQEYRATLRRWYTFSNDDPAPLPYPDPTQESTPQAVSNTGLTSKGLASTKASQSGIEGAGGSHERQGHQGTTHTRASSADAGSAHRHAGAFSSEQVQRDFAVWRDAFLWFLKKVTFRHRLRDAQTGTSSTLGPDGLPEPKPLLIKSPVHTARARLFLKLLPHARFVHIHRNPLQVFQSAAHMADTYYWYTYLQRPNDAATTHFILDQGNLLHGCYMADRPLVPPSQLHELSFEQLERDPLACLKQLYQGFGWGSDFERLRPRFEAYCATLGDFKKNQLSKLSPEMEAHVRHVWSKQFKEHGYV